MRRFISRVVISISIACALAVLLAQLTQAQTFTVLHNFTSQDGESYAGLTIDASGNLYGTTLGGGDAGYGTVFELRHLNSGWVFTPLYAFTGGNDGAGPFSRVIFGPEGSLYGTTTAGGGGSCSSVYYYPGCGTVFRLRRPATACKTALCSWTETVLYRFTGGTDGAYPYGDVIFDRAGNIYNTGLLGGSYGFGVVYELTARGQYRRLRVLYSFTWAQTEQRLLVV